MPELLGSRDTSAWSTCVFQTRKEPVVDEASRLHFHRADPLPADDDREDRVQGWVRRAQEDGRAVALHGQGVADRRHREDVRGEC